MSRLESPLVVNLPQSFVNAWLGTGPGYPGLLVHLTLPNTAIKTVLPRRSSISLSLSLSLSPVALLAITVAETRDSFHLCVLPFPGRHGRHGETGSGHGNRI